jgi:sigma-B regulation protein RsbU (phosphoserine phosphatase)
MKKDIIPEKFKKEYMVELSRLFYFRVNLFCYIAIIVFSLEVLLGLTFFKGLLSAKDMPGVAGGIVISILLLITGRFSPRLYLQKLRALFFTFLLILIAILAAVAHPDIISHLGITLVLLAFFPSVLLLPWSLLEAIIIGIFTIVNYAWISMATDTLVNDQIFGINIILLGIATFIAAIVERSEEILRKKDFALRKEIEEKNSIMAKELDLAKKIHKGLIPQSARSELADIAVTYKPMLYMGGDYAKFHFTDKNKLLFILADVTGHGVSSALLVNRVHTEIERLVRESLMPGDILKSLDEFINKDFGKMGFFLSAFCGMLDFSRNKLIYSNYGHPPQILLQSKENKVVLMSPQTFLMGIGMEAGKVYSSEVAFAKGDRLILFTDGIIEAKDSKGEDFGQGRLEELTRSNIGLDVIDFNERLTQEVSRFQAGEQADDIFLLTIQTK